MDNLEKLAT